MPAFAPRTPPSVLQLAAAALVTAAVLLAAAGCSRPEKSAQEASAPAEKHYTLHGEIVSVDAKRNVLTVQHQAIPGYMPAMTMEFLASPGDVANAKAGQRIRADLVPTPDGDAKLEKIWPDDQVNRDILAEGERALREDTFNRGNSAYREVGEKIPNFALCDQDGRVVTAAHFRGSQVMLNFIYTRCPIANMCPLETTKMIRTQKLAREQGVKDVQFVSITLDPSNDTPGTLREYAQARGIDTSNFTLLTGPEQAVKDLLAQFGIIEQFKDGLLRHTLATLLIDRDGKIVHRADGSAWEPQDFVAKMRR